MKVKPEAERSDFSDSVRDTNVNTRRDEDIHPVLPLPLRERRAFGGGTKKRLMHPQNCLKERSDEIDCPLAQLRCFSGRRIAGFLRADAEGVSGNPRGQGKDERVCDVQIRSLELSGRRDFS